VRSTCYGSGDRSTIVALEVVVPLAVALDGDVANLTQSAVLEFGPEVGHSDAHHRHTRRRWRMSYCRCA
jgi:hypothetical protein